MFHEDWYSDSQLYHLTYLVEDVCELEGSIIEIGCWEGKSAIALANRCYPEVLICNDTWLGNIQESIITDEEHVTEKIVRTRDVYGCFIQNMDSSTKKIIRLSKKIVLNG